MKTEPAGLTLSVGIPGEHRAAAARLYDEAFGSKLMLAIPDQSRRIELFEKHFVLAYAVAAVAGGKLVGIAGFSTNSGSLTGGLNYDRLLAGLGLLGGHRAAAVLSLYEREAVPGELIMDGIAVDSTCREMGIGTRLLSRMIDYGRSQGYETIRLDVIDTNAGARRLYERLGFVGTHTEEFEILRAVLGFGASTTMIYDLRKTR